MKMTTKVNITQNTKTKHKNWEQSIAEYVNYPRKMPIKTALVWAYRYIIIYVRSYLL